MRQEYGSRHMVSCWLLVEQSLIDLKVYLGTTVAVGSFSGRYTHQVYYTVGARVFFFFCVLISFYIVHRTGKCESASHRSIFANMTRKDDMSATICRIQVVCKVSVVNA